MQIAHRPPVAAREPGLSPRLRQRIETEFRPRWENDWGRRFVTHGSVPGPDAVRLDGNDYLSLTGHADILNAQLQTLRRNQEFIVQSGVFQLDGSPAARFEQAMAQWIGKEGGLLCQCCCQLQLISAVVTRAGVAHAEPANQ